MAIILTNQASLNYRYGTAIETVVSNVASTVLNGSLSVTKTVVNDCYRTSQGLTYIINVRNNSTSASSGAIVNDDLGTFNIGNISVTPLTLIGSPKLYINGIPSSGITTTEHADGVTFEIADIPPNGNAQVVYLAQVNEYACNDVGSSISNTVIVENECDCPCNEPSSDSSTINVCEYADVRIIKSVCPNPITCEDRLTYTFNVYNYGNVPATSVILKDTFEPALNDIEVTVNGVIIPSEDYDYILGELTLPAEDSEYSLSVPAATCSRDASTGIVTITPSSIQITVSGTL